MHEDEVFLSEIEAAPLDNARRLVYAHWLEDRQDERAEFLRMLVAARELRSFVANSFDTIQERLRRTRPHDARWLERVGHVVGVQKVTSTTFPAILQRHPRVVLQYWAPMSWASRKMQGTMEELARQLEGWGVVCQSNIEEEAEMASKAAIHRVPTMVAFRSGEPCGEVLGHQPVSKLLVGIATAYES